MTLPTASSPGTPNAQLRVLTADRFNLTCCPMVEMLATIRTGFNLAFIAVASCALAILGIALSVLTNLFVYRDMKEPVKVGYEPLSTSSGSDPSVSPARKQLARPPPSRGRSPSPAHSESDTSPLREELRCDLAGARRARKLSSMNLSSIDSAADAMEKGDKAPRSPPHGNFLRKVRSTLVPDCSSSVSVDARSVDTVDTPSVDVPTMDDPRSSSSRVFKKIKVRHDEREWNHIFVAQLSSLSTWMLVSP
ncbi:uncharacterized protein BXZ73DRAFT_96524 [Epithele typhae]|uniref:uncharacterized protein n=1 Tax=Epithele typhae TaxID=378194 RepID=UPI002007DFBA|nr:uncharacterized protein BXZ73DRAFT_96524 [Epithele typhae]KAH9944009.1 hypothetical protein BXZ73DRAFT_96524 [Epithele typhae]